MCAAVGGYLKKRTRNGSNLPLQHRFIWLILFVHIFVGTGYECSVTSSLSLSFNVPEIIHVSIIVDPKKLEVLEIPPSNNNTIILEINGRNLDPSMTFALTNDPVNCNNITKSLQFLTPNLKWNTNVSKEKSSTLIYAMLSKSQVDKESISYLCQIHGNNNIHLGSSSAFKRSVPRYLRSINLEGQFQTVTGLDRTKTQESGIETPRIFGLRVENSAKETSLSDDGIPELLSGSEAVIRLFGSGISEKTVITFTAEVNVFGGSCLIPLTTAFPITSGSVTHYSALASVVLPKSKTIFYICIREAETEDGKKQQYSNKTQPFVHQGSEKWLVLGTYETLLPLWASVAIICCCLMFSALFSGLNLGLMSLDKTELKILKNTGSANERKYAAKIQPVRDHGNYLLCSILLGNVLVNSTFTILLDGLTSGLVAVVCSTIAIVVFGEIAPQAACSRHGLAVGAHTIVITKAIMFITFPLSWPVAKFLDCILGEEIGNVYNRERLKELVKVTTGTNDLDNDEVNIISGALELRKKIVANVMTHIEDTFMLCIDSILDFETVSEIMKSGFSRVPVYDGKRSNIVTLLYIKDLAFVDPDDNTPLKTLCEFYQNPCHFVFEDQTLDVMFRQFKEGHKGHMAFVHRVNNEGDGDPFYETIGLVTLEDVIEELIQAEIMDETDVFTDNRTKIKRLRPKKQDFTIFAERRDNQRIRISPQLTLATFQYLTTTIDAFKPDSVSDTILRRLLNQEIVHHVKCKGKEKYDPTTLIFTQGKAVDFFVLILEGRVEVTVGRENLIFESGPFTYFGTQALVQNVGIESPQKQISGSIQSLNVDAMVRHTFVPDYSVRAVTEVIYIAVKRTLYLAAKRATLMERSQKGTDLGEVDEEVEKLLHSLDEDERSIGAHTAILNVNTPKNTSKPSSNAPSPTMLLELDQNGPATPITIGNNTTQPNYRITYASAGSDTDTPLLN